MRKNKIVNVLLLTRIFNNQELRNQSDVNLVEFVKLTTNNNIEYDIRYLSDVKEDEKENFYKDSCIFSYGFTIDEDDHNFKIVEDHVITLMKDKDSAKYIIVNEPKDTHKMKKLYVKKYG